MQKRSDQIVKGPAELIHSSEYYSPLTALSMLGVKYRSLTLHFKALSSLDCPTSR